MTVQDRAIDQSSRGEPVTPEAAWRTLHRAASAPYRAAGRFASHFARGKLGGDPVFRALLAHGWIAPRARVVDIGCGQGLLASLLATVDALAERGEWPTAWPAPPTGVRYVGIELMPRDIARARTALAPVPGTRAFIEADLRDAAVPPCDTVVILDVLHYVDHDAQEAALERVRGALAPRGRLLLRVGDASRRFGFVVSQWVDATVALVRGHRAPPTHGRTLAQWIALLQRLGFEVRAVPMSEGTPFANVLLVADCPGERDREGAAA